MRVSDEDLRNKTVIGADGHVVGQVGELVVEVTNWNVDSIRVKLRREAADRLGASHSVFHAGTIEIPIAMIQSVGDTVVLSVTADELRALVQTAPESRSTINNAT
jgi:sporulation protein YlmC with PRC-barrel domain